MSLTVPQNIYVNDFFGRKWLILTNYGFQALENHIWLKNIWFYVFDPFLADLRLSFKLCMQVWSNHGPRYTCAWFFQLKRFILPKYQSWTLGNHIWLQNRRFWFFDTLFAHFWLIFGHWRPIGSNYGQIYVFECLF